MFKKFLYHTKIYFFGLGEVLNQLRWKMSSVKDVHNIQILGGQRFLFKHYGTITEMLFTRQHLVNRRGGGGFEQETLTLFQNNLKKGDVILDIGANVGLFSLLGAKTVGNGGKIYAFEPSHDTFAALEANIELNGFQKNIIPQKIALSNRAGVIRLAMKDDAYKFMDEKATQGEEVPMIPLDDWAKTQGIDRVNFIKIDVEGAELLCFKGGENLLKTHRPIIIMECDDRWTKRFDYSVYEVLNFLETIGYRVENYDFSQWLCFPK